MGLVHEVRPSPISTIASSCGRSTGSVRRVRLSRMEKMAVLAPMPSPRDRIATAVTTGVAASDRQASLRSRMFVRRSSGAAGWLVIRFSVRSETVKLEGVYSVLPTPFDGQGEVDEGSLRRVIDLFIEAGVNGVTALGVTGEVARLDDSERRRVLEIVCGHVAGRIGVVAGTTADGTRTCINYSLQARDAGATAVMVSPPRMPKLNTESVV